ncbi:hypothetical protein RV02_GL000032 [Enterococcus gilvus]|nr:hypothetical protein RV02_GL000032 [Enterococcus gilvus]
MSKDELIREANHLENSLIGLEEYVSDRCSMSSSVTADDLSGLNGLVVAIKALSEKHAEHSINYLEVSE